MIPRSLRYLAIVLLRCDRRSRWNRHRGRHLGSHRRGASDRRQSVTVDRRDDRRCRALFLSYTGTGHVYGNRLNLTTGVDYA